MSWNQKWYESDTGTASSQTYRTLVAAEGERAEAREWGWNSAQPRMKKRRVGGKNGTTIVEYTVKYTRTSSGAAAADVKRSWTHAMMTTAGIGGVQGRAQASLRDLHGALESARTSEDNPITLELRVESHMRAVITACEAVRVTRQQVISHARAAHSAHQRIEVRTALIKQMEYPAASEVESHIQLHTAQSVLERDQHATLDPALKAQGQALAAVKAWQEAVRKRWVAQQRYTPVESGWDRLLVRVKAIKRDTPAISVTKEAVRTQVLHAAEVAPNDEAWRQAEIEVETTQQALLERISQRDNAMGEVAEAFAVNL